MSLSLYDSHVLSEIYFKQSTEIETLKMALEKQDRQIALLERLVSILETRQDDGR